MEAAARTSPGPITGPLSGTRRVGRASRAGAALAVAAAAVGACSSAGTSATAGCDAPGVSPGQIKIGVIYPDSGVLAPSFTAVRSGIDARIGAANAAGGINGRKIVYTWQDDQGAPDANLQAARDLVAHQGVFGIIESTIVATGSAQYLADNGIPVTGLAAEEIWSKYRNMFSFAYTTGAPVSTYGKYVKSRGGHRAVVLQTALQEGVSKTSAKLVQSLQSQGVNVVGTENYTPGADSPAAVAQSIINDNADSLVSVIAPGDFVQVLDALRAAGRTSKVVLSVSGYDAQLLHTYGPRMTGVTIPLFYRPVEAGGPAITAYEDAMARYSPQLQQPEQDFAMMSYIQTDMFLRGLEAAGSCPTRQGFIDGLRAVRSYDAQGMIQPIDVSTGLGRQTTCFAFVEANGQGSSFDVVEPNLCGDELTPTS